MIDRRQTFDARAVNPGPSPVHGFVLPPRPSHPHAPSGGRSSMRRFLLLSTSLLAVAACSDSLPLETSAPIAPALSVASGVTTSRYAVLLQGVPADFAAKVTSLGGTVELLHERAGVAILSGVSDDAARALQGNGSVELLIEDFG